MLTKVSTGVNSDVVMILHLNLTTNQVSILSLPRDMFVPNARIDGANKIDAGLYNGPSQLVAAIQEDFGIPINHYVELNFDTFADVVNVLGGIKMYFPMEVFDAYSGLYVRHPGCIQLNGTRALQVVRARHLQIRMPGDGTDYRDWPQEASVGPGADPPRPRVLEGPGRRGEGQGHRESLDRRATRDLGGAISNR